MQKIEIEELKVKVYIVKGEKDGKNYKFVSYEMILPDGIKVNMTESNKNMKLSIASKILFEEKIKNEHK